MKLLHCDAIWHHECMTNPRSQVPHNLRSYITAYNELTLHFAGWMDLPTSDGIALAEVFWAERELNPLSPAQLSQRIGMTSGATNALINRLETRGVVARTRESTDRRIVTLRVTPMASERAQRFIDSWGPDLETAMDEFDTDTHRVVGHFLETLTSTTIRINTRLRGQADPSTVPGD